ncbi:IS1380 family transposase [Longimicrobium sp.]|uniref:IS1380 family transposase n=1 Tax=Longimicrobium sp. TaxID=2029185 RepID=UPI003B3A4005
MGEEQGTLFSPEYNQAVRVEARPEKLTSDAGALLMREVMERLGYSELIGKHLTDLRVPGQVIHPHVELVRTALLLLAQGWSGQSDVALLRADPALKTAISCRRGQRPLREAAGREPEGLCSQPTLSRLHQDLGTRENRAGLRRMLLDGAERRMESQGQTRLAETTLDLDSLPYEVHGHQPGSARNGHYRVRCYHPLLLRSEHGDYLGAKLRPGNVHTADGGLQFALPILRRARTWAEQVWLRIDAGFPEGKTLDRLEEEGFLYVARLNGNPVLKRMAAPYVTEPPPEGQVRTHELIYRAARWAHPRRVVLVVLERTKAQGELFLDYFFLLTNVPVSEVAADALLERYRKRGTAEKDFGEWKQALDVSLSSSPRPKDHYRGREVQTPYSEPDSFAANEARLLLSLIAANLMHAASGLLERGEAARPSRERFRQLVLKTAARVVLSARRVTFVIESSRAELWRRCARELNRLYPSRGSPAHQALPTPA